MTHSVGEASYWAVTVAFWIFHFSVSVVFFSIFTSIEMHFHTSFHFLMPFSHLLFLGANLELFVSSAVSLDILVILCQEFSLSHSPWEPLLWDWFLGRVLLWYPMVLVFPHQDLHAWHQIVDWLYFFLSDLSSFTEKVTMLWRSEAVKVLIYSISDTPLRLERSTTVTM